MCVPLSEEQVMHPSFLRAEPCCQHSDNNYNQNNNTIMPTAEFGDNIKQHNLRTMKVISELNEDVSPS